MDLLYKVEPRGRSLIVSLQEQGSKRILYLDTLKALAKESDKEALALLVKLQMRTTRNPETITFQRVEVPPIFVEEALRLMGKTGRLVTQSLPEAPAPKPPAPVLPKLILTDSSGSFANLSGLEWEKDLLEAGYTKKIVDNSHYYCPTEKVKEALELLLAVGWQIEDAKGNPVSKNMEICAVHDSIAIRAPIRGLLDPKLQMDGVWEGEIFRIKKSRAFALLPLFESSNIKKEAPLSDLAFRGQLLPYQEKGVDWMSFLYNQGFSGLLADEMGLGKTVQVLAFLSRLRTNLPVLIVAPTSLLFNWRSEIDRFLPNPPQIDLISYTTLRLNEEHYSKQTYEAIVLDESNAIKTAATQTARAAYKLKARLKLCLSGTPMENLLDELWSQFHFLMPDLLERNSDLETVKRRIRPFILRRRKEEVQLDLPEKIEQISWIEMSDDQVELYHTYKKGIKIDGANRMEILEAILRLRQICVDPRLVGSEITGAKLEQLTLDIQEALSEKRKILIFSQFTSMLQLIRNIFPDALYLDGSITGEKRGEIVRAFQEDPNTSLFLISIKAGGVGLNLTAADHIFLIDPWWNEAVEQQAIARAHRIGQKKTLLVKRYLTPNSIEEKMLHLKSKKQETADQLLDLDSTSWTEADLLHLLS